MSQGKAIDLRERQLIVQLKEHFDQERFQGPSVSTKDPADRIAKTLGIGKRVVKEIVSQYRQTGKIAPPALELKGKPPYRIQPALEIVIRHEIRRRNREGKVTSATCRVAVKDMRREEDQYWREDMRMKRTSNASFH